MAVRQQDLDAAHGDCRAAKAYEAFRHSDGAAKSDHVWSFLLSIADSQSLPLAMNNWYGADGESLRAGIRFLSECRDDFENNGRIREEFKADLARCSGEDFLSDLIKWEPGNWEAVVLADHLVKHAEQFRRPLPTIATEAAPEVLPDPFQGRHMVSKLLTRKFDTYRHSR
jgi:hypothetical protein